MKIAFTLYPAYVGLNIKSSQNQISKIIMTARVFFLFTCIDAYSNCYLVFDFIRTVLL